MSPNTYLEGGKFQLSRGNAKWSQVTSLANSNLEGGGGGGEGKGPGEGENERESEEGKAKRK